MGIERAKHYVNIVKSSRNFENKPAHDRITKYTSAKQLNLFRSSTNFKCPKVSENTWTVCRSNIDMSTLTTTNIPNFNQVHTFIFMNGCLQYNYPQTKV